MFRRTLLLLLMVSTMVFVGCMTNKKVSNPIANVNSKQPDKVLYDRAMDAMKHNKFDVARLSLQTLINTYPDSEYVARAKLAIGDSWYAEGGSAAMAQAESEYRDFITFFPNMTEASEAQMKIANIHYNEMEKADRDFTHAKRAEEEYRQLIMQFPDSPLVPEAKKKLLAVQEVLADREFMIGHYYYLRETWPAAIARFKSLIDTYPLYSGADEALYELGGAYEKEVELVRRSKVAEAAKAPLVKTYSDDAAAAYDRILTTYPLEERADDARKRLEAMGRPIPKATPQAIAQDRKEQESRGSLSSMGKMMLNFKKAPDISQAATVGEPTLVDPKQTGAPEIVRSATASVLSALNSATNSGSGTASPAQNAAATHSDTAPPADGAATAASNPGAASPATGSSGAAGSGTTLNSTANIIGKPAGTDNNAIPELANDLAPPSSRATDAATPPAPTQVNDAPKPAADGSGAANASSDPTRAAPADQATESSSKKKKKKHIFPF